ncbi:MAG: hypothetical protein WC620_07690 [Methanoregula sp.]
MELFSDNRSITVFNDLIGGWIINKKPNGFTNLPQIMENPKEKFEDQTLFSQNIIEPSEKPTEQIQISQNNEESLEKNDVQLTISEEPIKLQQEEQISIPSSDIENNLSLLLNNFNQYIQRINLKKIEPVRSFPKNIPIGHKERT